jgi:integrase
MSKKLLPNMYIREYQTKRGVSRTRYYCQFTDKLTGKVRTFPLGSDFKTATMERNRVMALNDARHDFDAEKQRQRDERFSVWAERWLLLTERKKSHRKDVGMVARLMAFFGEIRLADVTPVRVAEYRRSRQSQPSRYGKMPSIAQINREVACLRSLLTLAKDEGVLHDKPTLRMLPEHNRRSRTASDLEYHNLLVTLPPHCADVLVLLWEVGSRITETLGLRWSCIDLDRGSVEFVETKTDRRIVPVSEAALAVLRRRAAHKTEDRVFGFQRDTFSKHFARAKTQLGIHGLWVHDFRRTFVTRKENDGWSYKKIMMMTGHKDLSAFDRYNHPTFDDVQDLMRKSPTVSRPNVS